MYPSLLSFLLVLIYLCYELCVTTVILWLFVIIFIIFRILIMQAKHVKNAKVSISKSHDEKCLRIIGKMNYCCQHYVSM